MVVIHNGKCIPSHLKQIKIFFYSSTSFILFDICIISVFTTESYNPFQLGIILPEKRMKNKNTCQSICILLTILPIAIISKFHRLKYILYLRSSWLNICFRVPGVNIKSPLVNILHTCRTSCVYQ